MQFTATLVDFIPEKRCEVPVAYLNTNLYHKNQKGYGIYQLVKDGYTMSKDPFIQKALPRIDQKIN